MTNRWDVMQAPLKLFLTLALACAPLCAASVYAQTAEKKAPVKVGAPKPAGPGQAG